MLEDKPLKSSTVNFSRTVKWTSGTYRTINAGVKEIEFVMPHQLTPGPLREHGEPDSDQEILQNRDIPLHCGAADSALSRHLRDREERGV